MLQIRNLACERDERLLFSNLNAELNAGEVLQVNGSNGSGKTSLLRIISGLSLAEEGEILWCGESVENNETYKSELAYLGHHAGIKLDLSPEENLNVIACLYPTRTDVTIYEVLEHVGLSGFEDVPARMLSAGQRRRVALARLLLGTAKLWILDEPFTAIDKAGVDNIERLIREHVTAGGMAILTTHHPADLKDCKVRDLHLS